MVLCFFLGSIVVNYKRAGIEIRSSGFVAVWVVMGVQCFYPKDARPGTAHQPHFMATPGRPASS